MDWLKFIELVCIPIFGWALYKMGELRKDINEANKALANFKVEVARDYATNSAVNRIETKLDEIRSLVIQEIRANK